MNSAKKELLDPVIDLMYEVGFGRGNMDELNNHIGKHFFFYGTGANEVATSRESLQEFIEKQRAEAEALNLKTSITRERVFKRWHGDDNMVTVVEEVFLEMNIGEEVHTTPARATFVLEWHDGRWQFSHINMSVPDANVTDEDSWGIEEYRKKNKELEEKVRQRTKELETSLENLKNAQQQLVQQEKLASLGQLTAGIAHEIKNPLNFVNNFSDLSIELVEEAREEIENSEVSAILDDIDANLRKIYEHGSRADGIVKSMLQHSRGGNGEMEPTDLNELVKEYVNLSFHGMRAGENPINVDIQLDLDEKIEAVPLIAEDFSRVIVNLCNNAFDAMREKAAGRTKSEDPYTPELSVRTMMKNDTVTIEIEDNGPGIPEELQEKILQPFFTTKKGTEGTGLGLSITHDIVKAHGGQLEIESSENGSVFRIQLT